MNPQLKQLKEKKECSDVLGQVWKEKDREIQETERILPSCVFSGGTHMYGHVHVGHCTCMYVHMHLYMMHVSGAQRLT